MARRVLEYNFMTDSSDGTWCVHIDTGGTFTDCIAESPDGRTFRNKTLSRGSLPASVARVCTRNILLLDAAWGPRLAVFGGAQAVTLPLRTGVPKRGVKPDLRHFVTRSLGE